MPSAIDPTRFRYHHARPEGHRHLVAIETDVVNSRGMPAAERRALQTDLESYFTALSASVPAESLVLPFELQQGGNAHCLLSDLTAVPDLLWRLSTDRPSAPLMRVAVSGGWASLGHGADWSHGGFVGPLRLAMDTAMQDTRALPWSERMGVVRGYGAEWDTLLSGYLRALSGFRTGMTAAQIEVVGALRSGERQVAMAERLGVTAQAISRRANQAGWKTYRDTEDGFRAACRLAPPLPDSA